MTPRPTGSKKIKETLEYETAKATRWIGSTKSVVFHSVIFILAFVLPLFGVDFDRVLLVLTTAVSLEAIYLAIFIQMSVNKNTADIAEIQEDVEEIQEDVDEIQEDIEEDVKSDGQLKKKLDTLNAMQDVLKKLSDDIEKMKKK